MSKTKKNNNNKLKNKSKTKKLSEKEMDKLVGGAPVGAEHEVYGHFAEHQNFDAPSRSKGRPPGDSPHGAPSIEEGSIYQNADQLDLDRHSKMPLMPKDPKQVPLDPALLKSLPDQPTEKDKITGVNVGVQEAAYNRGFAQSSRGALGQYHVNPSEFAEPSKDYSKVTGYQHIREDHDTKALKTRNQLMDFKRLSDRSDAKGGSYDSLGTKLNKKGEVVIGPDGKPEQVGKGQIKSASADLAGRSRDWRARTAVDAGFQDVQFGEKRTAEFEPERFKKDSQEVYIVDGKAGHQFVDQEHVSAKQKQIRETQQNVVELSQKLIDAKAKYKALEGKADNKSRERKAELEGEIESLQESKTVEENAVRAGQEKLKELKAKLKIGNRIKAEGDTIGEAPADLDVSGEVVEGFEPLTEVRAPTEKSTNRDVALMRNRLEKTGLYRTEKEWKKAEREAFANEYNYDPDSMWGSFKYLIRNTRLMRWVREERPPSSDLVKLADMHKDFKEVMSLLRERKYIGKYSKTENQSHHAAAKKYLAVELHDGFPELLRGQSTYGEYELEQLYWQKPELASISRFMGEQERDAFEDAALKFLNTSEQNADAHSAAYQRLYDLGKEEGLSSKDLAAKPLFDHLKRD